MKCLVPCLCPQFYLSVVRLCFIYLFICFISYFLYTNHKNDNECRELWKLFIMHVKHQDIQAWDFFVVFVARNLQKKSSYRMIYNSGNKLGIVD